LATPKARLPSSRTLTYPSREPREAALDTATKDGMDMTSTVHAALLERVL
jgi:hypothetical protein